MFRITRKADYAVFILSFLARRRAEAGADELVSAQELASFSSLNKSLVANLLKDLNRAGFLDSVRGARGGYKLARAPQEISLASILRTVEGPFSFVECASERLAVEPLAGDDRAEGDRAEHDRAGSQDDTSIRSVPTADAATTPANDATEDGASHGDDGACCNLSALCTSQGPLLVLHFRIQQLLEEISLHELSGLDRNATHRVAEALFPTRPAVANGVARAATNGFAAPMAARPERIQSPDPRPSGADENSPENHR